MTAKSPMRVFHRCILGSVVTACLLSVSSQAARSQCAVNQIGQLVPSEGRIGDHIGYSVALSGDVLAVGAPDKFSKEGAVFVYRKGADGWVEEQMILGSHAFDLFGHCIALDGYRMIISATGEFAGDVASGAAYLYEWNGVTWAKKRRWVGEGRFMELFGSVLSVSGRRATVGNSPDAYGDHFTNWYLGSGQAGRFIGAAVIGEDVLVNYWLGSYSNPGFVDAYRWNGSGWSLEQRLVDNPSEEIVGTDAQNNRIVVGKPWSHTVTIYLFEGGIWFEEQVLQDSSQHFFGISVSLDGDLLAVGADAGKANVFRRGPGGWELEQVLEGSDAPLGKHVALEGDLAAVGSPNALYEIGAADLFPATLQLGLEAHPTVPRAGDILTLTTTYGNPNDPVGLAIVALNGVPTFRFVMLGKIGPDYRWVLSAPTPQGLSGTTAEFLSIGLTRCGSMDTSNTASVVFQ